MARITTLFFILLAVFLSSVYIDAVKFPKTAKLCGDYWVHCRGVKPGMYHCRVYSKLARKLVKEGTYIRPVYYGGPDAPDLSSRVTRYEGDTIYFDGSRKLIACDIPEDAVRIQSLQGGAWISCSVVDEKEKLYSCTVYDVRDASVLSRGVYVLRKHRWDTKARRTKYASPREYVRWLEFVYYGGVGIALKDSLVMMPLEWIEYPDGPRSGVRVRYNADGGVLKEEEYG